MNTDRVSIAIKQDEGYRDRVYEDSLGIPTIGYGRNLTDPGIDRNEAELLFKNDLARAVKIATAAVADFEGLHEVAQETLVNMAFNMGYRLHGFKRMLAAMDARKWLEAAEEMRNSRWFGQVGMRAERLTAAIESLDVDGA